MKTRRSKTKILIWKFFPWPTLSYTITKKAKESSATQKLLRVLKIRRVLSDRILFRFPRDKVLFESSVIGSSSRSSVIDFSFGSPVVFFRHVAIFYQNVLLLFFIKNRCSVLYYLFKRKFTLKISLTRFNTSTKLIVKSMKENLHGRDTKYYIENVCHQFPGL